MPPHPPLGLPQAVCLFIEIDDPKMVIAARSCGPTYIWSFTFQRFADAANPTAPLVFMYNKSKA